MKKSLLIGITGLFAGAFASQCVDWNTLPKSALAGGVALGVSTIVWALTRNR